ncbi:hypothetical protein CDD83_6838 [Cordyceps sp. RAO-2017]|nr:hypothetical protein CDD83_6838 [Cordyceps sp. RAO-2017]
MINYLKLTFLKPQDRADAIEEISLFEELDQLHAKVLRQLYERCRGPRSRSNTQRLFGWVSMAFRPLTATELRSALAIRIGEPTKKSSYMAKFQSTIVSMSGALIEIGSSDIVRFIHSSVLEFMLSTHVRQAVDSTGPAAQPIISIDEKVVPKSVSLIRNKSCTDTYACNDDEEIKLPLLYTRNQETIPSCRYRQQVQFANLQLEDGGVTSGGHKRRPRRPEDERPAKRTRPRSDEVRVVYSYRPPSLKEIDEMGRDGSR